jgi:hypothetical protein
MGVRTRGLDINAGAMRNEAEAVIQCWNEQLALGRDMLWSPTIRAALLAVTPWLDVFCPGCGTSRAIDLRTLDRDFGWRNVHRFEILATLPRIARGPTSATLSFAPSGREPTSL